MGFLGLFLYPSPSMLKTQTKKQKKLCLSTRKERNHQHYRERERSGGGGQRENHQHQKERKGKWPTVQEKSGSLCQIELMIVIYLLLLFFIVLFWDVTLVSFVVVGLFLAVSVDMKPTKKSTALIEEGEGGGSLMWVCHPLSNSQITTNVSYFSPPLVAILCYVHCLPFFFFFFIIFLAFLFAFGKLWWIHHHQAIHFSFLCLAILLDWYTYSG